MTFYAKYKYFVRYWLPVLVWAGMIFYLSGIPLKGMPGFRLSDKVLHAIEFLPLSFLLLRAFTNSKLKKGAYWFAMLFAILYGSSDELHQLFVPGRVFDLIDVLFDGLGGVLIIVFSFVKKRFIKIIFLDFDKIKVGKRAQKWT